MFFWILIIIFVLGLSTIWSEPVGRKPPGGINSLEEIDLGGMKQWISIRGEDTHAPILLFLHGGPGSANLSKLRVQTPDLEKHFIVVNWDQRGAGKTYFPGFDSSSLHLEQYISEAHELIGIIKKRFGVEKIYLMGFSWGTVLGLSLVNRYPEDFSAYISVSQVVDYRTGEKISLEYTRQAAYQSGNTQAIQELSAVDPSYSTHDWNDQLSTERKWLLRFGGVYHKTSSYSHEIWMLLKAPEYSLVNFISWPFSSSQSLKQMWPELMDINFFERVTQINCPVYFFVGKYDYNSPWIMTERYFQMVNAPLGKSIIWFEQSAHDIYFDEPARLTSEILTVLSKERK